MDYEKKYKEALERARRFFDEGKTLEYAIDIATTIFPELAESEDEKIRKDIIHHIEFGKEHNIIPSERAGLWLAWLEKQGEQKPILDVEIPFGAKDSELEEVSYNIPNGYHAEIEDNKVIIKKGEQKLVEWLNELDKVLATASPEQLKEWKEKYFKEDCGWSEEDEKMINGMISHFEGRKRDLKTQFVAEMHDKRINWLKSLKFRIQPQQECGEEDESLRNDAIYYVSLYANNIARNESEIEKAVKCENWLKSLRPQNRWKPSVFHLECIEDAIAIYEERGINAIGLKEILEELKKLREEQV